MEHSLSKILFLCIGVLIVLGGLSTFFHMENQLRRLESSVAEREEESMVRSRQQTGKKQNAGIYILSGEEIFNQVLLSKNDGQIFWMINNKIEGKDKILSQIDRGGSFNIQLRVNTIEDIDPYGMKVIEIVAR